MTIADRRKDLWKKWETEELLPGLGRLQAVCETVHGHVVRLCVTQKMGDHHDLWCTFSGCGGRGHRSAFCSVPMAEWVGDMHSCGRLTVGEMAAAGYASPWAAETGDAYCVTPPCHDTKGITMFAMRVLPEGAAVYEQVVGGGVAAVARGRL
eukprot:TRINITY_DN15088_c0_g3_i2.p3 TRINITY_DN15088_c0_g3~~TRINITY_DN15088_c0_g3_i2.p3  ORF type:complete len:152 (-),score=9.66 TRINITY_DN15088_c0_g3_i2:1097-1552(-)